MPRAPLTPLNEIMEPVETFQYVPQRLITEGPRPRWESISMAGSTLDYAQGVCRVQETRHGRRTRIMIMRTQITWEEA
jgi:hypothetical protein